MLRSAVFAIIVAAGAVAQDPVKTDPGKMFADILKPYAELRAKFDAATNPQEKAALADQALASINSSAPKLLELAKAHPDSPVAVDALLWLVTRGRRATEPAAEAKKLLVSNYLASDRIGPFCRVLEDDRQSGEKHLREIRGKATQKRVQLLAGLSLGRLIAAKSQPTAEQLDEAEKYLAEVADEGRKIRGFPEESVMEAERALFEMRNLTIGRASPDIEGTTIDGKRSRLSDYRGKVLVVCVWASFAEPARAILPSMRSLAQACESKPVSFLYIAADAEKSRVVDFLSKEKVPGDHWWNGQKAGVLEAWNVRFFPTLNVFDAKSVLRYKNLNPKLLDEAVKALLKET